jgi:dephospho-CoA kinase
VSTVIGLMRKAGAGKDTVAGALTEHGYRRVAFADALRRAAYASDPWIPLSDSGYATDRLSALVDL